MYTLLNFLEKRIIKQLFYNFESLLKNMGNWFTGVWDRLFGEKRELKMVIVGLDAAGKTTILHKMRFGELV